jgi:hypothetical protein
MDLIRQLMKTRQTMYAPKADVPVRKTPDETEGITLATIIENKPKNSEVVKYFRARADELDGSS